jgi:8-oxo-dGTP diphosphatase
MAAHRRACSNTGVRFVRAAGGIVWRETAAGPRIALVHRPRRGDWSLPKGRVDGRERWQQAARREIGEETGCEVRLGRFAGAKLFVDRPEPKLVLYWHARVVREGVLEPGEVDEVAWLSRREALSRLDHDSDRRLLVRALGDVADGGAGARLDGPASARLGHADLRRLVLVDSDEAEALLPSLRGLLSRLVAHDARGARARRA